MEGGGDDCNHKQQTVQRGKQKTVKSINNATREGKQLEAMRVEGGGGDDYQ